MQKNFLAHGSLQGFLEGLAPWGELHGPVLTEDGVFAFRPINSPADLRLDYRRTLIPPKKYLLPPREAILSYSPAEGYRLPAATAREVILMGLHPCDLAGIAYLDGVFLAPPSDPLYRTRRNAVTLVGLSCEPDDYCFCGDTHAGGPHGFDIFMQSTEKGFWLSAGSPRGENILEGLAPLLEGEEPPPTHPWACGMQEAIREAAKRGDTFPESPLWEKFAARCLSCGACSLCCPTCYCFDVREYGELDGEKASRLREWDNCLFKSFGEVAGGHNFRKRREERFHYRFQHKYLGFGPTRGVISCVGCGRCREVCPVGIDLLELFQQGP